MLRVGLAFILPVGRGYEHLSCNTQRSTHRGTICTALKPPKLASLPLDPRLSGGNFVPICRWKRVANLCIQDEALEVLY